MAKKILVTGTGGYLGTSFKNYIEKMNATMPPEDQWHIVLLSVRDESWKEESFSEYDAILHVAGIVHRKEQPDMENLYHTVNTIMTQELAERYRADRAAVGKKAHFIFMSTMSVYGIVRGEIHADTPTNPTNFYGKSKLMAEQLLREMAEDDSMRVSVIRPPMIYGYRCSGNYASLEKLARKIPIFPKIKNQRSMLYIENLCEFLRLLILSDENWENIENGEHFKIYCPQNEEYVNTSRMVAEIRKANGGKMHLVPRFAWAVALCTKIAKVFAKVFGSLTYDREMSVYPEIGDYRIVDFEEGIRRSSVLEPKEEDRERGMASSAEKVKCADDGEQKTPTGKVSVLMSLYIKEKPEYFRASMDSILAQTYPADEIVLIEDGPLTEELYAAVADYEKKCNRNPNEDESIDDNQATRQYPRLVIHAFEQNQQLGRALAKGVELCSNELIARMDTDDIAMPERLRIQTAYMEQHPEVSVVGGAIREFNDEGTTDRVKYMPGTQEEVKQYIKLRNPLNHMTVMYRRSAILEAGNYQHFPFLEDYSLWSRMVSEDYQIRNMDEVLVRARTSMGLVRRRSGWSYYKNFKKLRKMQHELKLTSTGEYIKAQVGTFGMIMMPGWVKEMAYRRVLRK